MKRRMLLTQIIPILGVLCFTGCLTNSGGDLNNIDPLNFVDEKCKEVVIDETQFNNAQVDPYLIDYAYIVNDTMKVIVEYGGGCGYADFQLLSNGLFMESHPVQMNLILSLVNDDPCDALVKRELCFAISELGQLYKDSYQNPIGTVIFHLDGYDSEIGYEIE